MQGSFALSLLELFAYLIPGFLIEVAYVYVALDFTKLPEAPVWLALIVVSSYIIGHSLTIVSLAIVKFRKFIKRIRKEKSREERYSFYSSLRKHLRESFGQGISNRDEYYFSRRLVMEHCPASASTIDRLSALSLFSRNTCTGCLLCSPLLAFKDISLAGIFLILSVLLFFRYTQFQRAMEGTTFRAAYMYFIERTRKTIQMP